jgi:preprotein translocase subunit SecG
MIKLIIIIIIILKHDSGVDLRQGGSGHVLGGSNGLTKVKIKIKIVVVIF